MPGFAFPDSVGGSRFLSLSFATPRCSSTAPTVSVSTHFDLSHLAVGSDLYPSFALMLCWYLPTKFVPRLLAVGVLSFRSRWLLQTNFAIVPVEPFLSADRRCVSFACRAVFCGLPRLSQSWVPGDLLCVGCLGNSQQPFLGSCRGMDVLVFLYPFLPRYFSHMVVSFVSSIGLWPGLLLKGVSYHVFHILHLGLTSCWKLGHASPV